MNGDLETIRNRMCESIADSAAAVQRLALLSDVLAGASSALVQGLRAGHKVLTAGNGGSAAEAMHMAEELVGRFRADRRSLPGIALTADGTALTCIGNDFGFDHVFSRQIEGLGGAGDILVVFSTSGRAPNLLKAVETARRQGMLTMAILGRDGGALAGCADFEICVAGEATERIQEVHQVILHLMLEEVERAFPVV